MKGTRELRRTVKGVGLIRLASGVRDRATYRRMDERIIQLAEARRLDWLRVLRDRLMAPVEWFERTSVGDFAALPRPGLGAFTRGHIMRWLRGFEASESHRRDVRLTLLRLARFTRDTAGVPAVLRKLRTQYREAAHPVAWNRMRAHVQTFLADTVGRRDPAYLEVSDLRTLRATPRREGHPCTVAEAFMVAGELGPHLGAVWLTMCFTGAGVKELWQDGVSIDAATGHVRIAGLKRGGRHRLVPLVAGATICGQPSFGYQLFRVRLAEVSGGELVPYDGRRTYAKWLALALVPLPHQDAYLGHGPRTMTALYQRGNEAPYLSEDAGRLERFVRREVESAGKGAGGRVSASGGSVGASPRNRTLNLLIKSQSPDTHPKVISGQLSTKSGGAKAHRASGASLVVPEKMPEAGRRLHGKRKRS